VWALVHRQDLADGPTGWAYRMGVADGVAGALGWLAGVFNIGGSEYG